MSTDKPSAQRYPFVFINHLALMLTMLKHRMFFVKQAESLFGAPIKVIPPNLDVDPNKPVAVFYYSRDRKEMIHI